MGWEQMERTYSCEINWIGVGLLVGLVLFGFLQKDHNTRKSNIIKYKEILLGMKKGDFGILSTTN